MNQHFVTKRTSLVFFVVLHYHIHMRKRRMTATTLDPSLSLQINTRTHHHHGPLVEEIDGLIRVYKDGHVERPQIMPCTASSSATEPGVTSRDMVIDNFTNIWARFYLPKCHGSLLPLLVYFHGGGFCVGSAAWSCYHEFLGKLAARTSCVIMSVNYRLAPENTLPAAYDDGVKALTWVKQQALCGGGGSEWWSKKCNFSSIFLAGDSAGANIAYNVAIRLSGMAQNPLTIKGIILIQPFFGGERRTNSEKYMVEPPRSSLSLAASDTYWRLSLPPGANRDHPWCNPGAKGSIFPMMVCVAEMDILRDRILEMCDGLARAGKKVECVVHKGVGHAFQVLNKSQLSQTRTLEMISQIRSFISK